MSLLGTGAVAIWHDIAPEGRSQFYDWHGNEHMPERVGIAGFLRGRRYLAVDATPAYFNLYETVSPSVVTGEEYRQRLDNPTTWTVSSVRYFERVARSLCRVGASAGVGGGGLVRTWRYDVSDACLDSHIEDLTRSALSELQTDSAIAGCHVLIGDTVASAVDTAERQVRRQKNEIVRWILLVEGWTDAATFQELCARTLPDSVLRASGATGVIDTGLYQLQATALSPSLTAAAVC